MFYDELTGLHDLRMTSKYRNVTIAQIIILTYVKFRFKLHDVSEFHFFVWALIHAVILIKAVNKSLSPSEFS